MWVFKPNSGGQVLKTRFWKFGKITLFSTVWIIDINRLVCLDSSPKKCTKLLQFIGKSKGFPCAGEASTRKLFWEANHHQMNAGGDWSWRRREVWFATLFLHLCFLDDKRGWVGFGSQVCGYYVPILFLTPREDSKPFVVLQLVWDREYHLHTRRHHTHNKFDHEGRGGLVICDILLSHLGYKLTDEGFSGVQCSQTSIPYRCT